MFKSNLDFSRKECKSVGGKYRRNVCFFNSKRKALEGEISNLLFLDRKERTDPELLTVIILKEKAHNFDFLKASTTWNSIGTWEGLTEKNLMIQVLFRDTPTEKVGTELIKKLEEFNEEVVKEEVLFATTEDVSETTL